MFMLLKHSNLYIIKLIQFSLKTIKILLGFIIVDNYN